MILTGRGGAGVGVAVLAMDESDPTRSETLEDAYVISMRTQITRIIMRVVAPLLKMGGASASRRLPRKFYHFKSILVYKGRYVNDL